PYWVLCLGFACTGCGAFLGDLDVSVAPDAGGPASPDSGPGHDGTAGTATCTDGWSGDLSSDPTHCGACAIRCRESEVCSLGDCATECAVGLTRCAGACVNTDRARAHCGACDKPCAPDQACNAGTCISQASVKTVCARYAQAFFSVPARCNLYFFPPF